jgi:hypothetical protein
MVEQRRRTERLRPHQDRFGFAIGMVVGTIILSAAFGNSALGRVFTVAAEGVTLLFILVTSQVSTITIRLSGAAVALAIVGAAATSLLGTRAAEFSAVALGALLALLAPIAIIRRLRTHERITAQTVFGALCLYLLAGLFFAFLFSAIGTVQHGFFAQAKPIRSVDYTYFSFVTLATVGYGDLTARTDLGRMLAISEALMGQLYLVSAVALLVSNLGAQRARRGARQAEPPIVVGSATSTQDSPPSGEGDDLSK